ncbi:hypothetical protein V8D89_009768 [Ganoderma adspersum]
MTNQSPSSDIVISLDDFHHKVGAVAKKVETFPRTEALYYTLLSPIENVLSSSIHLLTKRGRIMVDKDIVYGPQVVLKEVEGTRTPDAAIMRIRSQGTHRDLELLAIFEVKPGPCTLSRESSGGQESPMSSPTESPGRLDDSDELLADQQFKASYKQICEQASRALSQLPPHRSIPTFFLTGFYFYFIMFNGDAPPFHAPDVPQFRQGTEDQGYNALLRAQHTQSVATERIMRLNYEVKYFRERYIDHQGHLTAQFAAALQSAIEGQEGPVLVDSWFTSLGKQGAADETKIAGAKKCIDDAVEEAIEPHEQAKDVFIALSPETKRREKAAEDKMAKADPDYNPGPADRDNMDADSSNNADTSMSTTSDSPIAHRAAAWDEILGSIFPGPGQREAAGASISGNPSDPFESPLDPLTESSPEARRQQPRVSEDRRPQLARVPGDGHNESEEDGGGQMSPSPMPRHLAGHQTGLIGHNITGGNQAGGRADTESDMDCSG